MANSFGNVFFLSDLRDWTREKNMKENLPSACRTSCDPKSVTATNNYFGDREEPVITCHFRLRVEFPARSSRGIHQGGGISQSPISPSAWWLLKSRAPVQRHQAGRLRPMVTGIIPRLGFY